MGPTASYPKEAEEFLVGRYAALAGNKAQEVTLAENGPVFLKLRMKISHNSLSLGTVLVANKFLDALRLPNMMFSEN